MKSFLFWLKISLKFVPKGPIDSNPALVQIIAWHRIGDKPLSGPILTRFTNAYMRHEERWVHFCLTNSTWRRFTDIALNINFHWRAIVNLENIGPHWCSFSKTLGFHHFLWFVKPIVAPNIPQKKMLIIHSITISMKFPDPNQSDFSNWVMWQVNNLCPLTFAPDQEK